MIVRDAEKSAGRVWSHSRVIEKFVGGIVCIPRRQIGPYSIGKDGLQGVERVQRRAHAFPGSLERPGGQDEAIDVVQVPVANDKTTAGE
jgi:hypothetical protein